jgi:hypothetical protein
LVSKKKGSTFATPNAEGVERDKRQEGREEEEAEIRSLR